MSDPPGTLIKKCLGGQHRNPVRTSLLATVYRTQDPHELIDLLTEEGFFGRLGEETQRTFIDAHVDGETFVDKCWNQKYNMKHIGLPVGDAYRLAAVVREIYQAAGMSSVLMLLSTSY
jgi:hypothetical protein